MVSRGNTAESPPLNGTEVRFPVVVDGDDDVEGITFPSSVE